MVAQLLWYLVHKSNWILDEYDERSARFHVRKVTEALANPGMLTMLMERSVREKDDFPFNNNVQKVLQYEEGG